MGQILYQPGAIVTFAGYQPTQTFYTVVARFNKPGSKDYPVAVPVWLVE
jgi:hypothetical protein